ncbi:hypothetical protein CEK25_009002 [Fusarium fujikuroi]|nr:hypothetical protein CEK25_009002 [Fusarium fujikuroi]
MQHLLHRVAKDSSTEIQKNRGSQTIGPASQGGMSSSTGGQKTAPSKLSDAAQGALRRRTAVPVPSKSDAAMSSTASQHSRQSIGSASVTMFSTTSKASNSRDKPNSDTRTSEDRRDEPLDNLEDRREAAYRNRLNAQYRNLLSALPDQVRHGLPDQVRQWKRNTDHANDADRRVKRERNQALELENLELQGESLETQRIKLRLKESTSSRTRSSVEPDTNKDPDTKRERDDDEEEDGKEDS